MDFETSTQDLVLQRHPSIVDDTLMSSFNSTFTLQEHCAEIIRYNNKEFYEQVKKEMGEKGIDRHQAMDTVRLQRLIDACDTKENTAFFLLQEWNYEPQICRFLKLLCEEGVNLENVEDILHNRPLHIAATKNFVKVAQFLINNYPGMLLTTNAQGELPVETAIKTGQDDVAAVLIRRMDHRRVVRLFRANQQKKASLSLVKITEEFKMQKSIVAILDCLISPRWPHPPCLASDTVPCLSWRNLQDTPTHFHVTYDILESDVNGRCPDEPGYEYTPRSCYYNLAKYCNRTLNKEILNHAVIKMLTARKWEKYALFWFRFRTLNYLVFLLALVTSFLLAARSSDPEDYRTPIFALDTFCILMTIWFLCDEIAELKREPSTYIQDVFNYLDLSGYALIISVYVFRFLESELQWVAASLATCINMIGVFKYSIGSRDTGMYIKSLGKIISQDIPRFLSVFCIVLLTFSVSFVLAIRVHTHKPLNFQGLLPNNTLRSDSSCSGKLECVILAGIMTWLQGSSVVSNMSDVGWLGALLIIVFMISVSVILLNILIAQLSLTYELVQEESLLSFTALRMQAVAIVEWHSRFKYWNLRKKYYIPGELRTREEVEELMTDCIACADGIPSLTNHIKRIQQRVVRKLKTNFNRHRKVDETGLP